MKIFFRGRRSGLSVRTNNSRSKNSALRSQAYEISTNRAIRFYMNWQVELIDRLSRVSPGGYTTQGPPASEPTAWAALALAGAGRLSDAARNCQWLADCQERSGAVGVTKEESNPGWPTALALLAWSTWQNAAKEDRFQKNIHRAAEWTLSTQGRSSPRNPDIGHDTTLVGWSWAADTHSWLEPTALFVRALTSIGYAEHKRTREAVRLLVDRLLPTGGANYGNTRVLDQYLLPHVQPSGLVMWALAEQPTEDPRIAATLDYLQQAIREPLGAASLAYAALGLKAHGRWLGESAALLAAAADSPEVHSSPYKLALIALASQAQETT